MRTFVDLYYDDFEIGDKWRTHGRTITESDMVMFNSLVGLQHPAFMDEEHMKTTTFFKKRFATGVMTIPYAAGLFTQLHIFDNSLIAMVGMEAKMKKPILVGDTMYLNVEIIDKKETKSPERGIISYKYTPVNQKEEEIAEIIEIIMIKRQKK